MDDDVRAALETMKESITRLEDRLDHPSFRNVKFAGAPFGFVSEKDAEFIREPGGYRMVAVTNTPSDDSVSVFSADDFVREGIRQMTKAIARLEDH